MKEYTKNLGKVVMTPKGAWSIEKEYEILDIVHNSVTDHAYISKQEVPSGVDLSDSRYWMPLNVSGYSDSNVITLNNFNEDGEIQSYTLEEAIKFIKDVGRKSGAILIFYNNNVNRLDITTGCWEIWQFNSINVYDWENLDAWVNVYYNYNKFVGWYAAENVLNKEIPNPDVGCYAFVGNIYNEAFVYRCDVKNRWTKTNQKAQHYIKVVFGNNVTIGANGNWWQDDIDTNIPVSIKGDNGLTPYLRWSVNNQIEYSYDNINWYILSDKFITNIKIKDYVNTVDELPNNIELGIIYGVGPIYAEDDTEQTNPIYNLYVYTSNGWVNNGVFNSISAGVVQEKGTSTTEVMSQDSVTRELSELESNTNKNYTAINGVIENLILSSNPQFVLANVEMISNKYLDDYGNPKDINDDKYFIQKIVVSEGDIYKIIGVTTASTLATYSLYGDGKNVFYQKDVVGKVKYIIIPKGVDTIYVQCYTSGKDQYKLSSWDIGFDEVVKAINTTMVGFNVLANMFRYNESQIDIKRKVNTFFDTKGHLQDIANDDYSVIYANVSEGDILLIESVVSPVTQPKYAFYKGEEVKFYYIDSVYRNTYFVVVPNGVDTIFVQQLNNVGSIKKVQFQSNTNSVLEERVDNIDKRVSLFEIGLSNEENITAHCEVEDNTYINITATKGEYANIALLTLPIKEGEKYRITNAYSWLMFRAYLIADSNGNIIEYMPNAEDSAATYRNYEITIPKGATILYIHHNSSSVRETNIYKITELSVPSKSLSLKGKKWVCIGDSLTESNIRATKNYHDYVANTTGIEVVNMGRSGTGYARTKDEGFAFFQRALNIPQDADVITIFGSGNDLSAGLSLGEPTDTSETESLCGYIHKTIDVIQTNFPLIPFGIITPTPWIGLEPSQTPNSMSRYSDAIVAICKIRGVPCFDLYHCSNLHPSNATFRELAYSRDDGNGVHPDENGHKLIAPRFKAFLETIVL